MMWLVMSANNEVKMQWAALQQLFKVKGIFLSTPAAVFIFFYLSTFDFKDCLLQNNDILYIHSFIHSLFFIYQGS